MSTLDEIQTALEIIAYGYLRDDTPSGLTSIRDHWNGSPTAGETIRKKVSLLHCTTDYPATFHDLNLKAMDNMRETFGLRVGFSDHSPGITAAIAAVARGATIIEKHITMDRQLPGPDHAASLEPNGFKTLISAISDTEQALGSGRKGVQPSEIGNRAIARKSLVAEKPLKKGDLITDEFIAVKRPGLGLSPIYYWDILGKTADEDYPADARIYREILGK